MSDEREWGAGNRMIMPPQNGVAFRLARQIIYSLPRDTNVSEEWQRSVLEACNAALECQDRMIAECQRLLEEVANTRPGPVVFGWEKPR